MLVVVFAVFSCWTYAISPRGEIPFLQPRAITSLLEATTIYAFLAVAVAPVMVAGGIDLSVGSTLALGQCACAALITTDPAWTSRGFPSLPGWVGVAGGVAVGMAVGLFNGTLIAFLKVPPFLLTLGTLSIVRGISIFISRSNPISQLPGHAIPGDLFRAPAGTGLFERFGKPNLSAIRLGPVDLYLPFIVLLITAAAMAFLLRRMRAGRIAFAVGGNPEAARLAGLPVRGITIFLYSLCGAVSGLAGVMSAYQYGTFDPQAGVGYELGAVASCVLGGVSLTGGVGGVAGPLLGSLLFAALRKGLNQAGVGAEWSELAGGGVIVAAVCIDRARAPRKS